MLYNTFPEIIQRVKEVKIYAVEYGLIFITGLLGILLTAIFDNKLWLIPFSISIVVDGVLMIITKKGLVSLAAGLGPTKEVLDNDAVVWGISYIVVGMIISILLIVI